MVYDRHTMCSTLLDMIWLSPDTRPSWLTPKMESMLGTVARDDLLNSVLLVENLFWSMLSIPAIIPVYLSVDQLLKGNYRVAAKCALYSTPHIAAMAAIWTPTGGPAVQIAARAAIVLTDYVFYKNLEIKQLAPP